MSMDNGVFTWNHGGSQQMAGNLTKTGQELEESVRQLVRLMKSADWEGEDATQLKAELAPRLEKDWANLSTILGGTGTNINSVGDMVQATTKKGVQYYTSS